MRKENGAAGILVIILLLIIIGGAIYSYFYLYLPLQEAQQTPELETKLIKNTQEEEFEEENVVFEDIPETESTPQEINNQALEEMDEIMLSVEGDEDLSDLGEY